MKVLVTGGGGFLGASITRQLIERGDEVTVLGRNRYPLVEALGATGIQHDLGEGEGLAAKFAGHDAVIHTAALAGMWGPEERYHRINVVGTQNVLDACRESGISKLVYTSSPSVTFDGTDEEGITEADAGYPSEYLFHYPSTKAEAERRVLAANSPELATCALRPHLIYGPGDPHLLPRLIGRHKSGRLRVIGTGENKVAITYVDNAAVSHIQALDALGPDAANAGKAYFITDGEPVVIWAWLRGVFSDLGLPPLTKQISASAATRVAGMLEWVWRTFKLGGEPPITRFTVAQVSASHWYDLSAARNDFGYAPIVEPDEGVRRMVEGLKTTL